MILFQAISAFMSRNGKSARAHYDQDDRVLIFLRCERDQIRAKRSAAQNFLENFTFKTAYDIELYGKIARKFGISIESEKILNACRDLIDTKSLEEFLNLSKALSSCGFSKDHLERYHGKILQKTLNFAKNRKDVNQVIAMLVHVKNLGIFDDCNKSEKEDLAQIFKSISYQIAKNNNLTDTNYRSLLEVSLYALHVLDIETPQGIKDLSKKRKLVNQLSTSQPQSNIFNRIIEFFSKGDNEHAWNNTQKPIRPGEKFQLGGNGLEIEIESAHLELVEGGQKIKNADFILKQNGKTILVGEVDGPDHYVEIDGKEVLDGRTNARNLLYRAAYRKTGERTGADFIVIGKESFAKFETKEGAEAELARRDMARIRKDSEPTVAEGELPMGSKIKFRNSPPKPSKKEEAEKREQEEERKKAEAKKAEARQSPQASGISSASSAASLPRAASKKSEDDFLREAMAQRKKDLLDAKNKPENKLLEMIAKSSPDLEELEDLLTECKASLSLEQFASLTRNLFEKVASKEALLILLVHTKPHLTNTGTAMQSKPPLLQKIWARFLQEASTKKDNKFEKIISKKSSWFGNSDRLTNVINEYDDNSFDCFIMADNCSRWELEYFILHNQVKAGFIEKSFLILLRAAIKNNFALMKFLVERNAIKLDVPVMTLDPAIRLSVQKNRMFKEMAIRAGVDHENLEMLRYLSSLGIDLRKVCYFDNGYTPLHDVCQSRRSGANVDIELVRYFVEELGYDVNSQDDYGRVPIMIAAANNDVNLAQYLISRGASLDYRIGKLKHNILLIACERGSLEMVRFLVETCKMPLEYPGERSSALSVACTAEQEKIVDYLLSRPDIKVNKDADAPNFVADPVYSTVNVTNLEILRKLKASGASFERTVENGNPLILAISTGKLEFVEEVVDNVTDIHSFIFNGMNALQYACRRGDVAIVNYLINKFFEKNIDPFKLDKHGRSLLHLAVLADSPALIDNLKNEWAQEFSEEEKRTLVALTLNGRCLFESFKYLYEKEHCNIDALFQGRDINGFEVPCYYEILCFKENVPLVQYLFSCPEIIERMDFTQEVDDKNALYYAVVSNSFEMVDFVHQKIYRQNGSVKRDGSGEVISGFSHAAFVMACGLGNLEIVEYLLANLREEILKSPKFMREYEARIAASPGEDNNRIYARLADEMYGAAYKEIMMQQHKTRDAEGVEQKGVYPMHIAIKSGSDDLVKFLQKNSAKFGDDSFNLVSEDGTTALHCAANELNNLHGTEMIEFVLANIFWDKEKLLRQSYIMDYMRHADHKGIEPWQLILENCETEIFRDNFYRKFKGKPLLAVMAKYDRVDSLRALFLDDQEWYLSKIDTETYEGNNAFGYACLNDNAQMAKFLIDNGANMRQKNKDGIEPIFLAIRSGAVDVVCCLLEQNPDLALASYSTPKRVQIVALEEALNAAESENKLKVISAVRGAIEKRKGNQPTQSPGNRGGATVDEGQVSSSLITAGKKNLHI